MVIIVKKRIALLVVASFLLCGVVSAASLWGSYKGNAIVRVNVDGEVYKSSGVQPIMFNGQVMLPLNALKKIGVNYQWNAKNQTVDIKRPTQGAKLNRQFSSLSKKYNSLTHDTYFFLQFANVMEFYYLENLKRSTSSSEDDVLRNKVEEVRSRYSTALAENKQVQQEISPLQMTKVIEIENTLLNAANDYVKAFEQLMIWKYSLDNAAKTTDELSKQAAQSTADKSIREFDRLTGEAQKLTNDALNSAEQNFTITMDAIQ